jgi:hypothetical protein
MSDFSLKGHQQEVVSMYQLLESVSGHSFKLTTGDRLSRNTWNMGLRFPLRYLCCEGTADVKVKISKASSGSGSVSKS